MSVAIWVMTGMAIWHFAVLVPDRFAGGIIGALLAALTGAIVGGYLLPAPGVGTDNPPGVDQALWPLPGIALALGVSYWLGGRTEDRRAALEAR